MEIKDIIYIIITILSLGLSLHNKFSSQASVINEKLEHGRIKMAIFVKDIENIKVELERKSNKDLVTEQFNTINSKLSDIKKLLEKTSK